MRPIYSLVKHELKFVLRAKFVYYLLPLAKIVGRWEQRIHYQPHRVVKHVRDQAGQQGAGQLQARVCIHFDQKYLEVVVDHEIEPVTL